MKTGVRLLLVGLLVVGMLSGCAGPKPQAQQEKVLRIGRPIDAISLDPFVETTAPGVWVYNNIYESLLVLDYDMTLKPQLATKWEQIDELTWRFYLRKGVKFHDGTPFNAEAVKFTFDRALNPQKPARFANIVGPIESVKIVDEYTVDIKTKKPYAPILSSMTMVYVVGILSPTAVQKWGEDYGRHPVGTGPFKFEEWKTNEYISLVRNDEYWGEKPKLDRIIFKVIPEEGSRQLAYDTGEIDMLLRPAPAELPRLKSDAKTVVAQAPGLRIVYVGFNCNGAPFNDARVRKAIAHLIDVEAINKYVTEGATLVPKGYLPTGVFGFLETGIYRPDPEKAAQLLQDAGYRKGSDGTWVTPDGKPFRVSFWAPQGRELKDREIAEAIQSQLQKAGVQVDLRIWEWGQYLAAFKQEPYQMFMLGWTNMTGDADYNLWQLFHGSNWADVAGANRFRYKNPKVDELLDRAQVSNDPAVRKSAYEEAQRILFEEVPWVPIYQTIETAVHRSYVKNFRVHSAEYYLRFGLVDLDLAEMGKK